LFPRCRHADIPAVPARPEPALPATRVAIPRQQVTQPRSSGFTSGARSRHVIGARAEMTRCAPTRPTRAPKAGISRSSAVIIAVPKRLACLPRSLISSGPSMPSTKPGKFSTPVVCISTPQCAGPSISTGSRSARAVSICGGAASRTAADDDDVVRGAHDTPKTSR
jgi:hypothetical protein